MRLQDCNQDHNKYNILLCYSTSFFDNKKNYVSLILWSEELLYRYCISPSIYIHRHYYKISYNTRNTVQYCSIFFPKYLLHNCSVGFLCKWFPLMFLTIGLLWVISETAWYLFLKCIIISLEILRCYTFFTPKSK